MGEVPPELQQVKSRTTCINAQDVFNMSCEKMDRITSGDSFIIPTGIKGLDDVLNGGIDKTDIVTILAASGCGKSAFAAQIANNISKHYKVMYCSMEMTPLQITERFIAQDNKIPNWTLREKAYREEQDIPSMINKFFSTRKEILFEETNDFVSIVKSIEKSLINGTEVVIIDYIQLLAKNGEPAEYNPAILSEIANFLKQIANRYRATIILLSQENEKKVAFGSRSITNASNVIIRVAFKEDSDGKPMVDLERRDVFIVKNRSGRFGMEFTLELDGDSQTFITPKQ
jgi:replicative DNA helicase